MEWNGLIDRHFVLGCVHKSIYSSPRFEESVLSYRHICPEIYLASVDELFIDMYFVLLLFRRHVVTMILNKAHRISRWKIEEIWNFCLCQMVTVVVMAKQR